MKTFICDFQSLEDFQKCFPFSKPFSERDFQLHLKRVDSQVEQYLKQGLEVVRVTVDPDEYLAWYDASDDATKNLSQKALMTAFATYKDSL